MPNNDSTYGPFLDGLGRGYRERFAVFYSPDDVNAWLDKNKVEILEWKVIFNGGIYIQYEENIREEVTDEET